jgi:hypothetical protein
LPGGKNHFAADRELADRALARVPAGRTAARENRAFLGRAVRYLAEEAGVRQFLDIGTGLPATVNVHEVAQRAAPEPGSSTWTAAAGRRRATASSGRGELLRRGSVQTLISLAGH